MVGFGIFILLVGRTVIPQYSQLSHAHGIISQLEIYKGARFRIEGVDRNFDYSVNAPNSSNLDNILKLSAKEAIPIDILYDSHMFRIPATGQERNSVWQFSSQGKMILPYNEISSAIHFWNIVAFWVGVIFCFFGVLLEYFVLKIQAK